MKKRMIAMLFVLLFALAMAIPVLASEHPSRLVDKADLFTQEEERSLLSMLDEISVRQQADVVVVTVNGLGGKTPMAYADDFYDENGYGFGENHDGILLLISMEARDYWITTTGFCITAFTDAGIDYISDRFLDDLSQGAYASAFTTYAELCDDFLTQAKKGTPYDTSNMPKKPFQAVGSLFVSLVVGFLVAFLVTSVMKSELKTVRSERGAGNYVKKGSMQITVNRDMYLYGHTTRRPIPKDTSSGGGSHTHTSSSGRSHGGGGGKF